MQSLDERIQQFIEMKKKYNTLGDWLAEQEKALKAEWLQGVESAEEGLPPVFDIRRGIEIKITDESTMMQGAKACLPELLKTSIDMAKFRAALKNTPSALSWADGLYCTENTVTVAWRSGILKAKE